MGKRKLLLIVIGVLTLSMLIGCEKEVEVGKNTKADKKNISKEVVVEQTERQKSIKSPKDHFEYIVDHQERVVQAMEDFDAEVSGNGKEPKLTDLAIIKLKVASDLAEEYNSYINTVENTNTADVDYKKSMASFKAYLLEVEDSLKKGTYVRDKTGEDTLLEMLGFTFEAYTEFDKLGVNVGF